VLRTIKTRSRLAIAGGGACLLLAATAFGAISTTSAVAQGSCIKMLLEFKLQGLAVFEANQTGVNNVAAAYGICNPVAYGGPTTASASGQVSDIDAAIAAKDQVIALTSDDPTVPASALTTAMSDGIKVITFDSDVPTARTVFIQDTAYNTIADGVINAVEKFTGPKADIAIMSSTPDATIQLAWIGAMKAYIKSKYPGLKIVTIGYGQSVITTSLTVAEGIIHKYPTVKALIPIDGNAVIGTAEAVHDLGKGGKIGDFGIGEPLSNRAYFANNSLQALFLWNEIGQGELIDCVAAGLVGGTIKAGSTFSCAHGPSGALDGGQSSWTWVTAANATTGATPNTIIFSKPLEFTKANYLQFNF